MGTGQLLAFPRLSLCSGTMIDLSLALGATRGPNLPPVQAVIHFVHKVHSSPLRPLRPLSQNTSGASQPTMLRLPPQLLKLPLNPKARP
jgi:hypothetical protein